MRTYRQLPQVSKVKRAWPASAYTIKLHSLHECADFGLASYRLGEVVKVGSKWDVTVVLDFADGRSMRIWLKEFHNLRTAIEVMRETVERVCDEHAAYAIQDVINAAQARADQDAKPMLEGEDDKHMALVFPLGVIRALNSTTESLADQLSATREYMGRGQGSLREFDINAYVARMIEHELIRRANVDEQHSSVEL